MRKYRIFTFLFFGCFLLGLIPSYAKNSKPLTKLISDCGVCHGKDGNSPVNKTWPKLAGQNANYLVKQLNDFCPRAKHVRYNPIMSTLVTALSEEEKIKIANYYAALSGNIDTAITKLLPLGQRLYRGGDFRKGIPACLACHGPAGLGNPPAGFPRLSGQHAAYVSSQLKAFREGIRTNDQLHMMITITKKMNDADIEAVANYISGLYY